jgi:hypothetical protein
MAVGAVAAMTTMVVAAMAMTAGTDKNNLKVAEDKTTVATSVMITAMMKTAVMMTEAMPMAVQWQ